MFTEQEKTRIRHHLGFLNVAVAATFVLGSPAGIETTFIIELAMNKVLPDAEVLVRNLVANCDAVESQMMENQELLAVTNVDEIAVRQDEFQALITRYHYWRNGMANALGCVPNPFDKRFSGGGPGSLNISVNH